MGKHVRLFVKQEAVGKYIGLSVYIEGMENFKKLALKMETVGKYVYSTIFIASIM
jgi:hypothetical protein